MLGDYKSFASGGRKESSATVFIKEGEGKFIINDRDISEYFGRKDYIFELNRVLKMVPENFKYDIFARVKGGGTTGQCEAIRLALSKAIVKLHPELKKEFKKEGLLTRDARIVERKKYGRPKARKRFQWTKR